MNRLFSWIKNRWFLGVIAVLILFFLLQSTVSQSLFSTAQEKISQIVVRRNSIPPSPPHQPDRPLLYLSVTPAATTGNVAALAQCLTDKQYTMYGSKDCSACTLQRSYFGESFAKIRYVDCGEKPDVCEAKRIRSYPAWERSDGTQYRGAIPLSTLAQIAGCPVPQ